MELEDLKSRWELLGRRLDRQQVIRRQDMVRMLGARAESYMSYVQSMILLGWAVIPVAVAIGKFRGVSDGFMWWTVLGYAFCLLPSVGLMRQLKQVFRCDVDIVEQEGRMTRYAAFARKYAIFQYVVVILFLGGVFFVHADYFTAHRMWWIIAAVLALIAVVCVVLTRYEMQRIGELQQRICEMQEFSE